MTFLLNDSELSTLLSIMNTEPAELSPLHPTEEKADENRLKELGFLTETENGLAVTEKYAKALGAVSNPEKTVSLSLMKEKRTYYICADGNFRVVYFRLKSPAANVFRTYPTKEKCSGFISDILFGQYVKKRNGEETYTFSYTELNALLSALLSEDKTFSGDAFYNTDLITYISSSLVKAGFDETAEKIKGEDMTLPDRLCEKDFVSQDENGYSLTEKTKRIFGEERYELLTLLSTTESNTTLESFLFTESGVCEIKDNGKITVILREKADLSEFI